MTRQYKVTDCSKMTSKEIVDRLLCRWRGVRYSQCKNDYYCGIAANPEERLSDHENNHWAIKNIVAVIDCGLNSKDLCCQVEALMNEKGVDVGAVPGRRAGEDTRYVYLLEKGSIVESKDRKILFSVFNRLFERLPKYRLI